MDHAARVRSRGRQARHVRSPGQAPLRPSWAYSPRSTVYAMVIPAFAADLTASVAIRATVAVWGRDN